MWTYRGEIRQTSGSPCVWPPLDLLMNPEVLLLLMIHVITDNTKKFEFITCNTDCNSSHCQLPKTGKHIVMRLAKLILLYGTLA
ncbi:hypothetical protein XELAEV_18006954mg [Xenopus laevis]|uniref:Uncharacterized protein n=1 Tax=Xenopus laevis TaxID=8355 RepID=A0A974E0M7_XENLA|nr:hypothetical protein XELAEV_18006954mg [Xenopus laevis]